MVDHVSDIHILGSLQIFKEFKSKKGRDGYDGWEWEIRFDVNFLFLL